MHKAPGVGQHLGRALLLVLAFATLPLAMLAPLALARDAFVTNQGSESVSVIDTQTDQVLGPPITVGLEKPNAIAITPDGRFAYVANVSSESVSVIDTQTKFVASPITVGHDPYAIAISPDGRFAYVTNAGSESVSVIDTQSNQVVGPPIMVGKGPEGIAISPDGRYAYVADAGAGSVSVIDTQSKQVVGSPIPVGVAPFGVAITPDGRFLYVSGALHSVSVIDTLSNQVVGSPIGIGTEPLWLAITPDGRFAYALNAGANSVSVIDTQSNQVVGSPIMVGSRPQAIAISADGRFAYVVRSILGNVVVIDTQSNQVVGSPIPVGSNPEGIAISPDQPPLASFTVPRARPGVAVSFNAAASSDPDGQVARYDWEYGDGQTVANGGPTPNHTYAKPGTYQAKLTLTDNEGCSTALIFTGQTAYCNGQPSASQTQSLTVAYPGVKVKCPKRAKPKGCAFELQALSKKREDVRIPVEFRRRSPRVDDHTVTASVTS